MAMSRHAYVFNLVYGVISKRLWKRYGIKIDAHIETMKSVGVRNGQGITFVPWDHDDLKKELADARAFHRDDRRNLCEALAALATNGEGYREVGVPSLHCQIAPGSCNIHLDGYGFVAIGPDGTKYYNPDLIQHIVDELGWATVVGWLDKRSPVLGHLMGRFHPILPNSRNRYNLSVGGKLDLASGKGWSLALDATVSLSGEKRVLGALEVLNW